MDDFWAVLAKGAQDLGSHWAFYTVSGSFVLYILGYLTLRFHLTALGIGTDLSVFDERYLFTGARFLIYLITLVPSLLLLVLMLAAPIYLPYRILPLSLRVKISGFISSRWQNIRGWWLVSNRLAFLGIVFTLLMIQLVMRQCFPLSNLLLAEDLSYVPGWLRCLLVSQTDQPTALYFIGLLAGALVSSSIFFALRNSSNQTIGTGIVKSLLGFLICVQLLLIPVNYGVLVLDKSLPRVTGLGGPGTQIPNEQAWLVWEGNEGKTFLLRKQQAGGYKKSLITLARKDVERLEISGYDRIFAFLFGKTRSIPAG